MHRERQVENMLGVGFVAAIFIVTFALLLSADTAWQVCEQGIRFAPCGKWLWTTMILLISLVALITILVKTLSHK